MAKMGRLTMPAATGMASKAATESAAAETAAKTTTAKTITASKTANDERIPIVIGVAAIIVRIAVAVAIASVASDVSDRGRRCLRRCDLSGRIRRRLLAG